MYSQFKLRNLICNKLKSCRMGLTNHTWPTLHHVTPLVIIGLGGGHTHIHTHTDFRTKTISKNQVHAAAHAWFKKWAANPKNEAVIPLFVQISVHTNL